jgi:K+-sensing histidine kinase KdpD
MSSAAWYRFSTSRAFIIATCSLRLRALRYLNQIIRTQPVRERGLYLSAGHFEIVLRGDERLVERQTDGQTSQPPAGDASEARFSERNASQHEAYGFGFVSTAAVLLALKAAEREASVNAPIIVFVLPIILSAYVAGLAPRLVSTMLAVLASIYFILPPTNSCHIASPTDNVKWVTLTGVRRVDQPTQRDASSIKAQRRGPTGALERHHRLRNGCNHRRG